MMKLVPQRFSRNLPILVGVVFFLFLLTAARLRHGSPLPYTPEPQPKPDAASEAAKAQPAPPIERPKLEPGTCRPEIEFLRRTELGLTDNIWYSRRCIKPIKGKSDRDNVTKLPRPLITHKTTINLTSCAYVESTSCDHLPLEVTPEYPEKQYQHLIFGVASKYDRINESLPAFAHWLAGTGSRLVAIIVDADNEDAKFNLTALEEEYALRNVSASFVPPRMHKRIGSAEDDNRPVPVEHHHFMLIRDLMEHSTSETQWFGVLDDDTFFPSLYPMDQELSKYDHNKPFWLGNLSDDFESVKNWGFMAFGGAGVFMSMPLAKMIEPHVEKCIAETTINTGDGLLRDCVYSHSRTKLTIIPEMYQHDFHGDASGFYESGVSPLSVHHWKSWYHEPMPEQASVTSLCGDCYLQRWQFGDDTLFVNGFSITVYRDGLEKVDLDRIEGTWANPGRAYDFSYGPLRPKLPKEQKKSYRLRDVEITDDGSLRQVYVYKGDEEKGEMDEVVELLWLRDGPSDWADARQ